MRPISSEDNATRSRKTPRRGSPELLTPIEHLLENLLNRAPNHTAVTETDKLAEAVIRFSPQKIRAVVLGGGTGLSTIVGGNSQLPDWPEQLNAGIKQEFPLLHSIVCTTDDGGSTGLLLRSLPIIGIGDLRKLLISSIQTGNLQKTYRVDNQAARNLARLIHALFNFRFDEKTTGFRKLKDPLMAAPGAMRRACPERLAASLRSLGTSISPEGSGPTIMPGGHAMGNLILAAAIFRAARGRTDRPPGLREIQMGIDDIAVLIGAPAGHIHAATPTPGQLKFRYANGVEVFGQSKSAVAKRDSPVEKVAAAFACRPAVSSTILQALARADVIIYAPGSLYTSIIPILQLNPIVETIRSNRKALKVLAANSWIQEGETDISLKNQGRGFLVSELIEAYDRNIFNGIHGLFDVVMSANLENVPANILRNYAIEGKSPIHLDRGQVSSMGVHPVEATLFSMERQCQTGMIHHDPEKFALALRTLLYADLRLRNRKEYRLRSAGTGRLPKRRLAGKPPAGTAPFEPLLCDYMQSIRESLERKDFRPKALKNVLVELAWENRDIRPSHLAFFRGAQIIPADRWNRSTAWDNVLGYFDPADGYIKLHENLPSDPARLREDLLTALGESLLGNYIEKRRWIKQHNARCYEIVLKTPLDNGYLNEKQLCAYLRLARMTPDASDGRIYRITINDNEGFLPPGLLFGLLYSWYLNGKGLTMEYEMNLLRWPRRSLIPLHAKDRARKESLVRFFRTQIFKHPE
ncbi:MAG TPA: 2-phospho-L-lactate transferase CofD family protein [Acidobacteriota bacterium]|nr:2-phospho-L-lactate transferase CofD family protein [Acidobacteriota bacterium]